MQRDLVVKRYLSLLGIEPAPPSLDHLSRLVTAQLIRVPFENISKLYLRRTAGAGFIPTLSEHLDGIEHFNFGGTCYANNPYFCELLKFLGYDVTLCGADMSNPDVHVVIMVELEDRQWLVDAGYAAPFFKPLARDLDEEHEIRFGAYRYVLEPQDRRGRSRLRLYRAGELVHGYVAKPQAREIAYFRSVIENSYRSTSTFMNAVVVEKFSPGRSLRFHNLTMTESSGTTSVATQLGDRDTLIDALEAKCGMTADHVRTAIEGLALEADIYS